MRSDPAAYTIRFQQLLFGLGLFGLGLLATQGAMRGGTGNIKMVAAGIVGVAVILLMDKHYWMLWPLAFWGGGLLKVPVVDVQELACIAVIGTHFVRRALRRETHTRMQPAVLFMVPYLLWVAVAFIQNPPGLFLFGSTTIGARFYFKIALGFACAVVLALQRLDEDDCRRLYQTILVFTIVTLLVRAATRLVPAPTERDTAYEFLGSATVLYLLLARYSLSEYLRLNWKFFAVGFLALATVYTGKRRSVFNVGIFPLVRALVTRQQLGRTVLATGLGGFFVLLMVLGQGRLYELPINMQRGLSFLPGRWDARVQHFAGGADPFRVAMRAQAWNQVRRDPWFGRKGFAIALEEIRWVHYSRTSHFDEGHSISGNWHNTWIGMMADFGIPAAVFWGLFPIGFLIFGFKKIAVCRPGSYQHTMVTFLLCIKILHLLATHHSGHSAFLPFYYWPMFGLLLGIRPPSPPPGDARFELNQSPVDVPDPVGPTPGSATA